MSMRSRREVLGAFGAGLILRLAPSTGTAAAARPTTRKRGSGGGLTTIAYNVLECTGFPSNRAVKRFRRGVRDQVADRIADELTARKPDLVNFAEAPDEPRVARIAKRLGMRYVYFRSGGSWPGAILTRLDVVEHRNCPLAKGSRPKHLFTRHWGRATIDAKGSFGQIVVHSVHLHPSKPEVQREEITALLAALTPDLDAGRSVIVQGDFNHSPEMASYRRWIRAGLTDTQAAAGDTRQATFPSTLPRIRIDYVLAAGPIVKHLKQTRVLYEGAFRADLTEPGSFALSDHLPVLARFG